MDNDPPSRAQAPGTWPILLLPLWVIVAAFMAVAALVGFAGVVIGLLSLVGLSGTLQLAVAGEAVRTTGQRWLFTGMAAALLVAGIAFWWLHRRGRTGLALLAWVALVALFLAVGWATGRSDVLSVGF